MPTDVTHYVSIPTWLSGNFTTVSELHWRQYLLLSLCAHSGSHYWWLKPGMSNFSFLCTFVPGSEKTTDGTFVPAELELSLAGTFVPVELSFLWNFRSFRTNRLFQELSLQASNNNLKLYLYTSCSSLREIIAIDRWILATDLPAMRCWRKGVKYR